MGASRARRKPIRCMPESSLNHTRTGGDELCLLQRISPAKDGVRPAPARAGRSAAAPKRRRNPPATRWAANPRIAQLHRLIDTRNRKAVGVRKRPRHAHQAVPICVCLDHRPHACRPMATSRTRARLCLSADTSNSARVGRLMSGPAALGAKNAGPWTNMASSACFFRGPTAQTNGTSLGRAMPRGTA